MSSNNYKDWQNCGPFQGCMGGALPGEPEPTTCYICGEPCVRFEQSIMGQILFGLCEEHTNYHSYLAFGADGPLGGGACMGLKEEKR